MIRNHIRSQWHQNPNLRFRMLCLNLFIRKPFYHTLIYADVRQPIIGSHYLRKHNLLVDAIDYR